MHSSVLSPATCMGGLSLGSPKIEQTGGDGGRDKGNIPTKDPLGKVPLPKFAGDPDHPNNVSLRNILKDEYVKGLRLTYATLELASSMALEAARARGIQELQESHKQEMLSLETVLRAKTDSLKQELMIVKKELRMKTDVATTSERLVTQMEVERKAELEGHAFAVRDLEKKLEAAKSQ